MVAVFPRVASRGSVSLRPGQLRVSIHLVMLIDSYLFQIHIIRVRQYVHLKNPTQRPSEKMTNNLKSICGVDRRQSGEEKLIIRVK